MLKTMPFAVLLLCSGLALAQQDVADRDAQRAERQLRAQERFAAADADGNGCLDRKEAQALGARAAHQRGKLRGMDDDGDGNLSRTELGSKAPRLLEQFATIDGNSDGELSQEELRAHRLRQRDAHEAPAPR